jgi:hypothetical protein
LDTLIFIAASYFIIVGVLTLVFNTSSYWMGVVSGSMSHQGDPKWRLYFEDRTIRELLLTSEGLQHIIPEDHIYDTADFPIQDGFDRGDLIVVRGVNSVSEISVGDVIIIQRENNIPLTHRVLAAWEENGKIRFTTKGDHNPYLVGDDLVVRPEQIVGKVIYVIPNLGSFFLWFQGG